MFNDHSSIFPPDRIEDKIGDQQGRVDDHEGGGELNDTMGDEQPARDEHPVFRKGEPHSTEDQKAEDADICEVLNNCTGINTVTQKGCFLKSALSSELCLPVENLFHHLC